MRKLLLLTLLFLSVLGFLSAQNRSATPWYMGKPIEEIRFEGLKNVSTSDLDGITAQFIKTNYSPGVYKDLQSKLFALDFFKKFTAEAEPADSGKTGVIIIFTVEERPLVDELIIKGNNKIRTGDILDEILLKRDDIFSTSKMKYDKDTILKLYFSKGYPDIKVESEVSEQDDNTVKVTFRIEEGSQTRIKEINFSGNTIFSDSVLKGKLSIKAQSLLNTGVFQENKLEADKLALETYYRNRGYIDAKIVEVKRVTVESENGRNYLAITFYFDEGEEWTFGEININGNLLFSDEDLLSLINH
ncbi:MAG: outer membrane protein assembly factor BamA, partial [Spirochaetales bacterium]|nr:outer membrane protein assembly factor BamA [Spirochaetales bacterium]